MTSWLITHIPSLFHLNLSCTSVVFSLASIHTFCHNYIIFYHLLHHLTLRASDHLALSHVVSLCVSFAHAHKSTPHWSCFPSTSFVRPCRLCSATVLDLQLLSNTYCQASETYNLSFARRCPANSTRYIKKKDEWCYACQELMCMCLHIRATVGLKDE